VNIDYEISTINGPGILLIAPGQVHQITMLTPLSGWSVNFESSLLAPGLKGNLRSYMDLPSHAIQLMEIIGDENTPRSALPALLTGLLYLITDNVSQSVLPAKSKGLQIKEAFIKLLYQHYKEWKKPSSYARELCITTSHLNDTIKRITGRSATLAIQEHCVLEAKRLLHFTDLDIKEICYELGYQHPSHFIKVFKTITGSTPLQYKIVGEKISG
jgi:AraC-like DNA-binding protein